MTEQAHIKHIAQASRGALSKNKTVWLTHPAGSGAGFCTVYLQPRTSKSKKKNAPSKNQDRTGHFAVGQNEVRDHIVLYNLALCVEDTMQKGVGVLACEHLLLGRSCRALQQ